MNIINEYNICGSPPKVPRLAKYYPIFKSDLPPENNVRES